MGPSRADSQPIAHLRIALRMALVHAATPAAVRQQIKESRLALGVAWTTAAEHIRAFDCRMIDELLSIRGCVELLVNNPQLTGRHLQRLALLAERASHLDDGFTPHSPFRVLHRLAQDGRLGRFPFLLRLLVRRVALPLAARPTAHTRARLLIETLLACPTLPADVLVELDGRLVAYGLSLMRRTEIARHPSAGIVVWRSMLRHSPTPEVMRVVARNALALQDPVIRATVEA